MVVHAQFKLQFLNCSDFSEVALLCVKVFEDRKEGHASEVRKKATIAEISKEWSFSLQEPSSFPLHL